MGKIKVVVVDDSIVARNCLRCILENDGEIEVVGEAKNGKEALSLVSELKPHLVTMDLEMPVMNGLDAIKEIMATCAVPILVVSADANEKKTFAALELGALDAVSKPQADVTDAMEFIAKVKLLSKVKVITHLRSHSAKAGHHSDASSKQLSISMNEIGNAHVFAIASSTGGPQALAKILSGLPADFPSPILIAQHISDGFESGMAKWLSGLCKLPVHIARSGDSIEAGIIYMSPSLANLAVTPAHRVELVPRLPEEIYHPNCDVLLSSVANVYGRKSVGIILSGMGSDGVQGMIKIRQAGGNTLAQDEDSSVVFGMNKVAIDRGGVQKTLPIDEIALMICHLAGMRDSETGA